MAQRRFLGAKFLVPVAVIIWLVVSLPLWVLTSRAHAQADSDVCPTYHDFYTGGQHSNDAKAATRGVRGMDYDNNRKSHLTVLDPCASVSGPLVYGEKWSSDGDLNYYVQLASTPNGQVETKNLRRWSQAQNTANILVETIPDDQGNLPPPCLDPDGSPCKRIGMTFVGALVYDNNHGWKEIHPTYSQSVGASGTTCNHRYVTGCQPSTT
jgi:ribosomal protein L31